MALEANLTLYGTAEPPAVLQPLRAGRLEAWLEGGNLRSICFDGAEVLRGIYFLVRDTSWGTYPAKITGLAIDQGHSHFSLTYQARCQGPEGSFTYQALITGDAAGRLSFRAAGTSPEDFPANRIGFAVLHPLAGVAGAELNVEHVSGATEKLRLPEHISPDQPVSGIRALEHQALPGLHVTVRMEGDAFEMEDQRNWTDASFKTYVRPLASPRPFVHPARETLTQSVHVSISDRRRKASPRMVRQNGNCVIEIGKSAGKLPGIALALDPEEAEQAIELAGQLRSLAPQWLVLRCPGGQNLAAAGALAQQLEAKLWAEIIVPGIAPDDEIAVQRAALAAARLTPDAVAVYPARDLKSRGAGVHPPGQAGIADIILASRRRFPGIPVGGGTPAYFTELNRNPPPAAILDFVSHGGAAIVHAADDLSVMGTLEAWPYVLQSSRRMFGAVPYWLGLSAIGMPHNPYGAAPAANPDRCRMAMARLDPRHSARFGAAFALGLTAAAAGAGAEVITLAHAAGDFGVLDFRDGSSSPTPLFNLLRFLASAAGEPRFEARCSQQLACLAFDGAQGPHMVIANLTADLQTAAVPGCTLAFKQAMSAETGARANGEIFGAVKLAPFETVVCSFTREN